MVFLDEKVRADIIQKLGRLDRSVKIINFTQTMECRFCAETRQLLEELAALTDKLSLEVYDFVSDGDQVEAFGIDKIPATVIMASEDTGIRFYGIPSGYEFATLLDDLLMVSQGDSGLTKGTRSRLTELTEPLHLQVFVTPTCPYCPGVVRLAHQFALESRMVTADMVEVTEFPHLGNKYGVMGIPKTVANDTSAGEGMMNESQFLERVLAASVSGVAG